MPSDNAVSETQDAQQQQQQQQQKQKLEEIEAKAVDKAKMSADAAFRPAPSVFNAPSAQVLLQQVDGPSLQTYDGIESIYVGRSVPVVAGGKLNVPINVATPGSVVSYAIELKSHDINFSITAEREEGVTIVKVRSCVAMIRMQLFYCFETLHCYAIEFLTFFKNICACLIRKSHVLRQRVFSWYSTMYVTIRFYERV